MPKPSCLLAMVALLAMPLGAQSPLRAAVGGSVGVLGSHDGRSDGFALGGQAGVWRPATVGPLAVRAEASWARVHPVRGYDCAVVPGGSCSGGPEARSVGSVMAGLVTPLADATRPFLSVGAGVVRRGFVGGDAITSGALSAGIGLANLRRGRAGSIELRAVWMPGAERAVMLPLTVTVLI